MPAVRKTTAMKVLDGRPGRPVNNAPEFAPLLDAAPGYLNEDGAEMWERLTTAFDAAPVLQVTDYYALAALCEQWQLYRAAAADVAKRGHLVRAARRGGPARVKNPSCTEAARALAGWSRLAARFGLTPLDRARLDVPPAPPAEMSPLERVRLATRRN